MTEYGLIGVDWEERINFDRLRRERLAKAKAALAESEADALFIFRLEDVRYVTGFRCHLGPVCYVGLGVVVLPRDGEPLLYTMDQEHARARMPWLDPEQILPRAPLREGPGAIGGWVKDVVARVGKHLESGTIGVDIWTPELHEGLPQALPKAGFVNGQGILYKAKIIHTEDELECLKAAAMITEAGFDAALRILKPGVRECEVLAEAWRAMTALGSEWTQCANIVCSGPYTAPYRRFTSDRVIRKGDPVIIDIGGCFNGYWGDFTRTYVCGDIVPTKEQIELHQACYDSLFAACEASRPGNTNADVYRAAEPNILGGSLGHGSGTGPWEPPYFSAAAKDNPMVLQPGMEFSIEPYAGKPGVGGFRLENNVIVREWGPEVYSQYPFDERLLKYTHPLDTTTGRTRPGEKAALAALTR